ncbi:MAG: right-handed parallel beta-helix repeat-containing protein [Planctomycetota bacterium]
MRKLLALIIVSLFLQAWAVSSTIYIPADYSTIQAAIHAAQHGDVLLVAPGTYPENIDFLGKSIALKSVNGSALTTIEGDRTTHVVTFDSGEGPWSTLEGFTLINGDRGILCENSSPTIRLNLITQNDCNEGGAGILCSNSDAVIIQNEIADNTAWFGGGGIECRLNSKPQIKNNVIRDNFCRLDGGGISLDSSLAEVVNNIISGNTAQQGAGGGIDIYADVRPLIINNTIFGNRCLISGGGGISIDWAGAEIINTILWNNSAPIGPEIRVLNTPCLLYIRYSAVQGGMASLSVAPGCYFIWGPGMIEENPEFVDPVRDNLKLSRFSPCINRGSTSEGPDEDIDYDIRPYMGTTDMGADEFVGTHTLGADNFLLNMSLGGSIGFSLNAGAPHAGRQYLLLGNYTGTTPGSPLPGGMKTLPLNWDFVIDFVLTLLNTPFFQNFYGTLDAGTGMAAATLDTFGPVPGSAGIGLSFAFCLNNPFDFVSNPIEVEMRP